MHALRIAAVAAAVAFTCAPGAKAGRVLPPNQGGGNVAAALPSATTSQLYSGTGTAGAAQPITIGTGLSVTGTTLNASGGGAVASVAGRTGAVTLTHTDISDFVASVISASPVSSVAGRTGAINLTHSDLTDWNTVTSAFLTNSAPLPAIDASVTTLLESGGVTAQALASFAVDARGLDIRFFYNPSDGSDWQPAYSRAIAQFNSNFSSGIYTPIYFPGGVFTLNTPVTTPFAASSPASVTGNGQYSTWIQLGAGFTGTFYNCSQVTQSTAATTIPLSTVQIGCRIRDLSITGTTASSGQDAIMLGDNVDRFVLHDVAIYDVPGYCLSAGLVANKTNAGLRESYVEGLSCYGAGTVSKPAVYVTGTGTNDGSNQDLFQHLRIYGSTGDGAVVDNANSTSPIRKITYLDAKIEKSGGDNWRFGSTTNTQVVTQINCIACSGASPSAGNNNFLITSTTGPLAPNNLTFTDTISETGSGTGNGFNVQYGRNITARFISNTSAGTQLTVGCGVNGSVFVSGQGDEANWSKSICGTFGPTSILHIANDPLHNSQIFSGLAIGTGGGTATAIDGSGNVTLANTADLSPLAPLASPAFTGTPTVPTATAGTNTTQAASTAFVAAAVSAGGGSSSITVTTTYTAAGAIAITDNYSLINAASALTMTLAADTVDGHTHTLSNYGAGTANVTLSLYGTTQTISLATMAVRNLFWNASRSTYLYAS